MSEEVPKAISKYGADDFSWMPDTHPHSRSRREVARSLALIGWEQIFESVPGAVGDAYNVLLSDCRDLLRALADPDLDMPQQEHSLHLYVKLRFDIKNYQEEFGLWFGLPKDARRIMNEHVQFLNDEDPFSPEARRRLLRIWHDSDNGEDFLEDVHCDDLGELVGTQIHPSPLAGERLLNDWTEFVAQTADANEHASPIELLEHVGIVESLLQIAGSSE